jgi:hypothetical protein
MHFIETLYNSNYRNITEFFLDDFQDFKHNLPNQEK